ncbi:sensor histidine kinase [Actinophytocola oryzae]|uniref:histidine kinase n=1 Tax=Actinophytocola oryzae TaxID=502181 RepID=A0A4R7UWV4_9PSEU|nr:sensor histidine kinase [Actinophytocola oryzae]TDV40015.1 sensor histidine kinase regulating citrate/malate metabolism [Actinophytocola oryzae]
MNNAPLSRQLLGWQLLMVVVLLAAVTVFSAIQSNNSFKNNEGRRMLSVAEDVAATASVRAALANTARYHQLPTFATSARNLSGADFVVITRPDLTILTSPDPGAVNTRLPIGDSMIRDGRSWVGVVGDSLVAHVPVISDRGSVIGIVAAGVDTPTFLEGIVNSPAEALFILGIATVVGVVGSLLLAGRVKRQTFGLEPREIAGLVEHREAMLHGIREGVVGIDAAKRITLVNDQARRLLSLPEDVVGRHVDELDLNDRLVDVLTGRAGDGADEIALRRGRVLIMNRMPITAGDAAVGSVVTLRDRTDFVTLQQELDTNRGTTDALRAQAHEFTNRLHTIAGLIELGEYDEVRRYVDWVSHTREAWHAEVSERIGDAAVAALLIAKASVAAEHNVGLRLTPSSRLAEVDESLSADLVTVIGNLVDNAVDALPGAGWIEVDIQRTGDEVRVVVTDSGPGVAPDIVEEVFRHGFTTKAAEEGGQRGLGLALTRQACRRHGGSVEVHGAVFTARLGVPT